MKTSGRFNSESFFIVSQVVTLPSDESENGISLLVQKAQGEKCPRCWSYDSLKEFPPYGKICEKCCKAVEASKKPENIEKESIHHI